MLPFAADYFQKPAGLPIYMVTLCISEWMCHDHEHEQEHAGDAFTETSIRMSQRRLLATDHQLTWNFPSILFPTSSPTAYPPLDVSVGDTVTFIWPDGPTSPHGVVQLPTGAPASPTHTCISVQIQMQQTQPECTGCVVTTKCLLSHIIFTIPTSQQLASLVAHLSSPAIVKELQMAVIDQSRCPSGTHVHMDCDTEIPSGSCSLHTDVIC